MNTVFVYTKFHRTNPRRARPYLHYSFTLESVSAMIVNRRGDFVDLVKYRVEDRNDIDGYLADS